jgi:anaerobic magnesium-protoporphyrin IX monomethyl ester cyclase
MKRPHKKILLIYPYFLEDRIHVEEIAAVPIGLYSVGAVLRDNDYDVEILNWHCSKEKPIEIESILKEKQADWIGFSIMHANRWGGVEIARIAKRLNPGVRIVFGGIGATFLWEHLLKHFPEVDYVVLGEGEYVFLDLIRAVDEGGSPGNVRGIAFRKSGKRIKTEDAEPIQNLDELPVPAKYFHYQHVTSTRGCAWQCAFCGSPKFWGNKVRLRSPEHFVQELALLHGKGINFFYFSDDTFTIKRDRVIEMCQKIIEKDLQISWYVISRVDCVDEEVLYWMRKAGCIQISFGIESGSEKIRERLNKKLKNDQIKRAFEMTTKYGILPRAYFIYGSPGETWETIQETIDLMMAISPLSVIFYILDIFPGTALYERFKEQTNLTDDLWLNRIEGVMYFETDRTMNEDLIRRFGRKLRTSFYENVHRFVDDIELVEKEELYEKHADFLSRLGMTFSHGDYSNISEIREKERTAKKLFERSLEYAPNHRAYLGLGILNQKQGDYDASIRVLSEGIKIYPDSEHLNKCLGISYMNTGNRERAVAIFSKFFHTRY